jgi:hypothetical protein
MRGVRRKKSLRLDGGPALARVEGLDAGASLAVFGPRSRSYTTPLWLTMKVITPLSP